MRWYAVLRYDMVRHVMLWLLLTARLNIIYAMLVCVDMLGCRVMICFVMRCHDMACFVKVCYVMLGYVLLWRIMAPSVMS